MSEVDSKDTRDHLRARLASMGLDKELASFLDAAVSDGDETQIASVLHELTEAQEALPRLLAKLVAQDSAIGDPQVDEVAVPDVHAPDDLLTAPTSLSRVLIVEDHALLRAGLEAVLDQADELEVVGTADLASARAIAAELQPDVILMDIALPDQGVEALFSVKRASSASKVIVLGTAPDSERGTPVIDSLLREIAGFVDKTSSPASLVESVRRLAEMGSKAEYREASAERGASKSITRLTAREVEVLRRIAEGHTLKDISSSLELSIETVRTYRQQLLEKLKQNTRFYFDLERIRSKDVLP